MPHVFVFQEWDILREQKKEFEHRVEKFNTTDMSRPSFGIQLQEARIRKRLTTTEIANILQISAKSVSMFENGSEIPSVETASILGRLLGF